VHAIKAEDVPRLEMLVQSNTLAVLESGETELLDQQLGSLPGDETQKNIWVMIARAWTRVFSGQIDAVEYAIHEAEMIISHSKRDQIELDKASGHIAAIRSYVADLKGDPARLKTYALEALAKLPDEAGYCLP